MKKLLILFCLFLGLFAKAQVPIQYAGLTKTYPPEGIEPTPISTSTCNPTGSCPPIGDPYIGDCFAGLERYLTRSIEMDGLAQMNAREIGSSSPCYDDPSWACNNYPNICINNQGGYCPTRYCEDISMAVDLKASMLLSVFGPWGADNVKSEPGQYLNNAAIQAVKDINRAYDCAGLRRPIIGANITEQVDYSVYYVSIPQYVKDDFADEFTAAEASLYSTTTKFSTSRICPVGTPSTASGNPDLSRVEARMYFYHMATMYINAGYKQFYIDYINNSPGYDTTIVYKLIKKVRQYAASKNTFVLFGSNVSDSRFYFNGNMIFDYRATPSRPLETDQIWCTPPISASNTIITPNNDNAAMYHKGGTSPYTQCNYSDVNFGPEARVPFAMGIDVNKGVNPSPNGPGSPYASQYLDAWNVWGYDEARWLNSLPLNCQADWLRKAYLDTRAISHRAAFNMPGRKDLNGMTTGPAKIFYRMYEKPGIISMASILWTPDLSPSFSVTRYCFSGVLVYAFEVNTINPSTVYTWHIQKPGGLWEPFTISTLRVFQPSVAGIHKVGLRCDNLGYPVSDYGTRITDINLNVIFNCPPPMPHSNENGPTVSDEVKRQLISQLNLNGGINGKKFSMEDDIYIVDRFTANADKTEEHKQDIKDLSKYSPCIIYPNPANKTVNVSWNEPIQELVIVDVVGRIKKQIKASGENYSVNNIDISGLGTGIYFMKVKTATNIQTKSFTVQQ